jgi:hypothetical protein
MSESENPKKFYCEVCKKTFTNVSALNKHYKTASHIQNIENENENEDIKEVKGKKGKSKVESLFYCPLCHYQVERKDYFIKHIDSIKHKNNNDKYIKEKENRLDFDELNDLLNELNNAEVKIGIIKNNDGEFEKITDDEIDNIFKINEDDELFKQSNYPKHIKHTKTEGKSKQELKKEKEEAEINELKKLIADKEKTLKLYDKQRELYKTTKDLKYYIDNIELNKVKKQLDNYLEKLKKLQK